MAADTDKIAWIFSFPSIDGGTLDLAAFKGRVLLVANTGSVSLSYDGDPRAAYLLLDDFQPTIRRVEYDVDRELKALSSCGLPHADWMAKTLVSASPQMP